MGVYQARDLKKPSGGKRRRNYKVKRRALIGRPFVPAILAKEEKRRLVRGRGGNVKVKVRMVRFANVADKASGKVEKAEILGVVETPANREYKKRNIITKGTVIETSKGLAVVTSRPGQDGVVNAILIEKS